MKLSDVLAVRCIMVKRAALDPATAREEFENAAAKERVARSMAGRFENLAKDRSEEESEKTPMQTATDRLWPMPHTTGEAAWRLPAIGAGGYAGYQFAKNRELPDVTGLSEMVAHDIKPPEPAVPPAAPVSNPLGPAGEMMKALHGTEGNPHGVAETAESFFNKKPERFLDAFEKDTAGKYLHADKYPELGAHYGGDASKGLAAIEQGLEHRGFKYQAAADLNNQRYPSTFEHADKGLGYVHDSAGNPTPVRDPALLAELIKEFKPKESKGAKPPLKGKVEKPSGPAMGQMGKRLHQRFEGQDNAAGRASEIESLFGRDPHAGRQALGPRPGFALSAEPKRIRAEIDRIGGGGGLKTVRDVARNWLHGSEGSGAATRMASGTKWKRLGSAGLGLAAGSILSGLPLAIRAVHQRRYGGEAAVRARERVDKELGVADEASKRRDEILQQMSHK